MEKSVVFVIPTMRMGGAEQSLLSVLKLMVKEGYDVDLFLFEKGGELLERIPSGVNVTAADTITRALLLEFRFFYKDLIKEKHFLIFALRFLMLCNSKLQSLLKLPLVNNWKLCNRFVKSLSKEYDFAVGYLEGTTDMFVIDKIKSAKKIGWIHSDIAAQVRDYKFEGKYYQKFDELVIISELCKNSFLKIYPNLTNKFQIIENIADEESILKKSLEPVEDAFTNDKNVLITVGRLEEAKGIDIALDAAVILRKKGINFKWHIYGDGFLREELQRRIDSEKIKECFILEGAVKNPYKYMKAATVLVQPSRFEGKSIVLDEAKIIGVPIVATNYPSVKDQLVNGKTALIAELNAESLAQELEKILNDTELRQKLAENCNKEECSGGINQEKIKALLR